MAFDDVFKSIGDFGTYQKRVYGLLLLTAIPVGFHFLAQVFLAGETDHWCNNPVFDLYNCSGVSSENCKNITESFKVVDDPNTKNIQERNCLKYDIDIDELSTNNSWATLECTEHDGWIYDKSQYHSTIIQDWNLVCRDDQKAASAQTIMFGGVLVGSFMWGSLADQIGRKKVLFMCLFVLTLSGTLTAVSPAYWFYCIMRFCVGASAMGTYLLAFVISTEIVGPKPRTFTGITIELFFAIGYMLLSLLAYCFRSWRTLQLLSSLPIILLFILYPFIPESPRWLVTKRRYEEAITYLKKFAKGNGTDLSVEFSDADKLAKMMPSENINYRRYTVVDLFRTKSLCLRSLNLFYNWMVNSLVYYGLSMGTSDMGVNDYVGMFVSGAVELPAVIFCLLTSSRFGRGKTISLVMIIGGLACFTTMFLEKGVALLVVAMIGKFCITASFALIYIFSAEQFPTPVRAVGIGCCSVAARIGGMSAPQILYIGNLWEPLPNIVFSVMSISAGVLVLFLPETLNAQLPETIEDGENFGSKHNTNFKLNIRS